MLDLHDKKIGIWGFGLTGQSALRCIKKYYPSCTIGIYEKRELNADERALIEHHGAIPYAPDALEFFLADHDYIIPSPGIDVRPYTKYAHKWLCELDLFATYWKKPIIAITGSVGKTTVTHLLSSIIQSQGVKIATGGNIGICSLDLLEQQENADMVLLEVSSFQLEHVKNFAPTLGIWTNLYRNHLDRHGTVQEYAAAKAKILAGSQALLPWNLRDQAHYKMGVQHYLSKNKLPDHELQTLSSSARLYFIENSVIKCFHNEKLCDLFSLSECASISFIDNVLTLVAALHLLDIPLSTVASILAHEKLPEHRLEKIAVINSVTYYNDSKATIPASTLAALDKLQGNSIILMLGGVSKGVDRHDFIKELCGRVKAIVCFGKEAEQLRAWCIMHDILAFYTSDVDQACAQARALSKSGDLILFSPAGASFDLFNNYQERGNYFKKLILG